MSEVQTSLAEATKRPWVEQRKWVRHLCPPETRCLVTVPTPGVGLLPAVVRNISAGGISLALRHPVAVGTVLDIHLSNATHDYCCDLEVRVVFVIGSREGDFALGGSFNRVLSDEELQKLL